MIRKVTIRNFKRFREETFEFADSVVLAGPNNAGKSTLLQAIMTWKLGIERWIEKRSGVKAAERAGVPILRNSLTSVPLREMNLLWEDRRVSGPQGITEPRLIEILVSGETDSRSWEFGIELQYRDHENMYVRPRNVKMLDTASVRRFSTEAAKVLDLIFVSPLSGVERDEPRRDPGLQNALVGQGRSGDILRNLLLEIAERKDNPVLWESLVERMQDFFGITLIKPIYSPAQPWILCEYHNGSPERPLDLASAGSGTLQVLLLFAFLYAHPASVILLDEPDAHQDIVLQRRVYDAIRNVAKQQGSQLIVATHSEVILDATAPERILVFEAPSPMATRSRRDKVRAEVRPLSGSKWGDLDFRRVRDYFGRVRGQDVPDEEDEAGWRTLADSTEIMAEGCVSLSGMLLFGRTPNRFLPQAGIDAAAFAGPEKDYAAQERATLRGPMTPFKDRHGDFVETGLVEKALEFVRRNTPVTATLEDGARRVERRTYPEEAVREAVVNALIHRDYLLANTDIELVVYRDRLEIVSPGRLPNGVTPERMRIGTRAARNPLLKEVMRDYGYLESMGMGVPRKIVRGMREHNGTDPDLVEEGERFTVRLFATPQ